MAQTVEAGGGLSPSPGPGWADGTPPPFSTGVQQVTFAGKTYFYQPPVGTQPGFVVFPGLGWISNVSSVDPNGHTINTEAPAGQSGGGVISLGNNNGVFGMILMDATTGKNTIMPTSPSTATTKGTASPYKAPAANLITQPAAPTSSAAATATPTRTTPGAGGGFSGTVGGGGQAGTVPSGLTPATTYNAQQLEAQYGYASEFFKDTGLSKLVEQAVKNQWDPANFAAHLMGTSWYKTHTAAQRQWEQLRTSDPAEARAQQQQMMLEIQNRAGKDGVTLDQARITQLASDALQFGWNSSKVDSALGAEYRYNANQPGAVGAQLKAQASQYLVPISDQTLQTWAQHVIGGQADQAGFDAYLAQQAKSLFPGLSAAIDAGIKPTTFVDPYKQVAAQTLGVAPDSIDFMQPKWMKAIQQVDPKTGQRTAMNLADWTDTLRTDPTYGYDQSANGRAEAAALTTKLGQTMGAL